MPPAHATPASKPTDVRSVAAALRFLDDVKEHFVGLGAPERYNEYLAIMKDFKTEQLDTPGTLTRVGQLLAGAPRLLRDFNKFLPRSWALEHMPDGAVVLKRPDGTRTTVARGPKMRDVPPGLEIPPFKPKPKRRGTA